MTREQELMKGKRLMLNLVAGRVYDVELRDCCINGEFRSKLLKMDDDLIFENGVTLTNFDGCIFTEVDPEWDPNLRA